MAQALDHKAILLVKAARPDSLRSIVPPLGLMYLASCLRRDGLRPAILDLRLAEDRGRVLDDAVDRIRPAVVGISCLSIERDAMREVAFRVRARSPDTRVIVGGPHATAFPSDVLDNPAVDAVVVGEGEEVITGVVRALADRKPVPDLPGVYARGHDPGPVPSAAPAPDVDALPIPAWDLLDLGAYWRSEGASGNAWGSFGVVSTSRGCPFKCAYCHRIHGKRYRPRSPDSVREELDYLRGLVGRDGVIEVLDDAFNLDPDRACRVLDHFAEAGLRPAFPNAIRTDIGGDDLLDRLAAARSPFVALAFETASERVMRMMRRNLDLDAARRAAESLARRRVHTSGFFMLGFPGETRAEMLRTIDWACSLPLGQALFFRFVPFPGTDIWQSLGGAERVGEGFARWSYFSSRSNLSGVGDREFAWLVRLAYLRFYARPSQVWRTLRTHPRSLSSIARHGATLASMVLRGRIE